MIRGDTVNELYAKLCYKTVETPHYETSPRGMKIRELLNETLVLTDPYSRIVSLPSRDLSLRYLAGELAFYIAGSDDLAFISHYSSFWSKISDDGYTVNSAYGKRLWTDKWGGISQFQFALLQLLGDADTRKAVMTIYNPHDSELASKDHPCTMMLQFFIRGDALHLTVYMRSNDIWLGTPYDIAFFTFVQERMLVAYNAQSPLPISMGSYTHHVGSIHAYEKHWEEASDTGHSILYEDSGQQMPRIGPSMDEDVGAFLEMERSIRTGEDPKTTRSVSDPALCWILDNVGRDK